MFYSNGLFFAKLLPKVYECKLYINVKVLRCVQSY